ncbi:hypothetical protein M8J77_021304 [Diaphorina citri]|nr:hypothetical protein M8J77_021304 [Diaphorina citri]
MRRNACAQTNEAGVMNYDVMAYGSVCRDVKLHDLPPSTCFIRTENIPRAENMSYILNTLGLLSVLPNLAHHPTGLFCPNSSVPFVSVPRRYTNPYLDYVEREMAMVCDIPDPLAQPQNQYEPGPDDSVDFIVVGAGAAGSVVASRLSEVARWSVAVIEAGGPEPVAAQAPGMYFTYDGSPIDWSHALVPMTSACLSRNCKYPRGKVMGGTTVLNGLMYCRGDSSDYDEYEKLGATGWGYKNVLPYFLKSEHNLQYNSSQNHARGGLLTVSHYNDLPDLGHTLLAAGRELGYPTDVDIGHGRLREGFYRAQMTTRNGARLSAAKAFVRPFLHRSNLKVLLNAQVMRVLFNEHNEAIGVQYMKNNRTHNLYAVKEVIISAGTIMSPVILMSSGIGNPDHLQEKGVPVRVPLRGVGENLKNHVSYQVKVDLLGSDGRNQLNNRSLSEFLSSGTGPLSSTGLSQVGAMIKYNARGVPSLQVFFAGLQALNSTTGSIHETNDYNRHFGISPTLLKTKSTGRILLRDNNPLSYPAIHCSYLKYQEERSLLIQGIRWAQNLVATKTMREAGAVITPYIVKGCEYHIWDTDEFWECAITHQTNPENHQVGTCKMGVDELAVVDATLQVYGTRKLRVIDASVLPDVPSGNLMAPTIMVGEKGADHVKTTWSCTP